jgi:hypothetical protein
MFCSVLFLLLVSVLLIFGGIIEIAIDKKINLNSIDVWALV